MWDNSLLSSNFLRSDMTFALEYNACDDIGNAKNQHLHKSDFCKQGKAPKRFLRMVLMYCLPCTIDGISVYNLQYIYILARSTQQVTLSFMEVLKCINVKLC